MKSSKMELLTLYKAEKQKEKASIKGQDLFNLKKEKEKFKKEMEKLQALVNKYQKNKNLLQVIEKAIQKKCFYFQTYNQQIFDLYYDSDTLTKYNYDLLHFDLLLKNENLNNQLLNFRLNDIAKKNVDYNYADDYIKAIVYDKTEKNIINKLTNEIILNEIEKNDKVKLDFIKTYIKNLYKYNGQKQAMTISRYKKYIKDRYNYLLSD